MKKLYFLDKLAPQGKVRHDFPPQHRNTATPQHRNTAMKRWFDQVNHRTHLSWACVRLLLIALSLLSCQSQGWGKFWETATTSTTPPITAVTACATLTASDSLTMVCIPANTAGFSMGSAAVGGTAIPVHTVASITAFAMAKYEVKYADWLTVKTYATGNGYTFANAGVQGDSGGGTNQHPVTTVNWRDSIIWCNAASQKDGLTPVYYTDAGFTTPLKVSTNTASVNGTAGSEDTPYVKLSANGYRLPTEAEWEYGARYIDGTTFMRGDAPSGWQDNNPANGSVDTAENNAVAWYTTNSGAATHVVGTALGNALGLFDMSGNVYEWVWDWNGTYTTSTPYTDADSQGPTTGPVRVLRGGSWNGTATSLWGANRGSSFPWNSVNTLGFRPVRRP